MNRPCRRTTTARVEVEVQVHWRNGWGEKSGTHESVRVYFILERDQGENPALWEQPKLQHSIVPKDAASGTEVRSEAESDPVTLRGGVGIGLFPS
ncbi:hypothetical protein V8C34DRAFT_285249, partial [Trichoderma compactum]